MTDTTIMRADTDLTREQHAIMLNAVCHQAKRVVPVVGTAEYPTPWDLHHARLDELLSEAGY